MFHLGNLIKQLRKEQKLTQEALGKDIISKSEVSKIEMGTSVPNILVLGALFQRLGKTLAPFEIIVSNREYERLVSGNHGNGLKTIVVKESDYVKDMRESRGFSQEKFGLDIYVRETISKIENGRQTRHRKFQALMKKLEGPAERYFGYIVSKEYKVYELAEKFRSVMGQNTEEEWCLWAELKLCLDLKEPVNRQFVESIEVLRRRTNGRLEEGETLTALEKCLRYTMPEYDGTIYRIPFRQEEVILKEIVKCMKGVGRGKEAKLLEEIITKKNEKKRKIS